MKIIKTSHYKKIESTFEGSVYSPETEDEWVDTIKKVPDTMYTKRIQPRNRNRSRFRPTITDKVPFYSLPHARQNELERDQIFEEGNKLRDESEKRRQEGGSETLRRVEVIKAWIDWIGDKYIRDKLRERLAREYRKSTGVSKEDSFPKGIGELYHASQGREGALRQLEEGIGRKIPIHEPTKLNNPHFN